MMVPTDTEYSQFGRPAKLLIHPKDVPELSFPGEAESAQDVEDEISSVETLYRCEYHPDKNGVAQSRVSHAE